MAGTTSACRAPPQHFTSTSSSGSTRPAWHHPPHHHRRICTASISLNRQREPTRLIRHCVLQARHISLPTFPLRLPSKVLESYGHRITRFTGSRSEAPISYHPGCDYSPHHPVAVAFRVPLSGGGHQCSNAPQGGAGGGADVDSGHQPDFSCFLLGHVSGPISVLRSKQCVQHELRWVLELPDRMV